MQLKDKVAVVIGASATGGTGRSTAQALAAAGAKVVVSARNLASLQSLAEEIGGFAIACDISDEMQVADLARKAVEAYGPIDIAVSTCAQTGRGTIAEIPLEALRNAVEVNFLGQFYFVRHMAAAMSDGGSIILFSSASAHQPMEPYCAYACSKAAADCLVGYAATEFGPRGIRVNSIIPGPIRTDLVADVWAMPGMEQAYEKEIALGRIGAPEDFAQVVVWLAGPHYITGVNLPVSGGIHLTRLLRPDEVQKVMPTFPSAEFLARQQ